MKDSKLFIAGIVAFALALGVILGNFCGKCNTCCCKKADMSQCMRQGMMPPPPPGPHGDFQKDHRPPGDFHKGPKHKGHMNPEVIDSLLQVTPEQKAALDANRAKGDSIFKELRKQKHDAEKALGEALESGDQAATESAKAKVLDADKALLEHRINGVKSLAKVLSKEQLEKFNQFHKDRMKEFKEHMKKGPHGHGPHGGPHGNPGEMPPPPPQE